MHHTYFLTTYYEVLPLENPRTTTLTLAKQLLKLCILGLNSEQKIKKNKQREE